MNRENPFFQIAGPLFLLFAVAFAGKMVPVFNLDLLLVAAVGLFLTAKWNIRGCAYAFVLLSISSVAKHFWIREDHLLQLVLESSVGFSLLIAALVSQEGAALAAAANQQIENRSETIRFLEEDLDKHREASAIEKSSFTEKLADLQQNLEEVQGDTSALHILNEVLRKSTAHALEERSALASQLLQSKYRLGGLLEEVDLLQKELNRVANESELAKQNGALFEELNAARFKEASTLLVNEGLLRERERGVEALERLRAEREEALEREQAARAEREAALAEAEALRSSVQGLQSLHSEELEKLRVLAVRSEQTSNVEYLYRQLKMQFDEKNQVLHETRAELFRAETELQTMRLQDEQRRVEVDPLEKVVRGELEGMEKETRDLAEENRCLQDLVTHLMDVSSFLPPTVKKKLKTPPLSEQASLF